MRAVRFMAVCAAALLVPAAARANPWHFGAQTGLALTNIHGDLPDIANPDYKSGFQGGGFVEYAPGPVAIDVEISYIQKGAVFKGMTVDDQGNVLGSYDSRLELSYLEVPVLARVSLPLEGAVVPCAVIGPTFGFALDAKETSDAPGFQSRDLSDDLQSVDEGATVGLGARIGRGPTRWLVEARYFTGFSDLWDLSGNLGSINHGFGLTVGVIH